jgi:hypothetical protein
MTATTCSVECNVFFLCSQWFCVITNCSLKEATPVPVPVQGTIKYFASRERVNILSILLWGLCVGCADYGE